MHLYNVMLCWINLSQSQSVSQSHNDSISMSVSALFINQIAAFFYSPKTLTKPKWLLSSFVEIIACPSFGAEPLPKCGFLSVSSIQTYFCEILFEEPKYFVHENAFWNACQMSRILIRPQRTTCIHDGRLHSHPHGPQRKCAIGTHFFYQLHSWTKVA